METLKRHKIELYLVLLATALCGCIKNKKDITAAPTATIEPTVTPTLSALDQFLWQCWNDGHEVVCFESGCGCSPDGEWLIENQTPEAEK